MAPKTKYLILAGIVYMLLAYLALFWKLDSRSIRLWDEGLYAVNAYEMSENGHYLVRYFQGKPMDWNTKPPLVTWVQVALIKTIGPGIWAMRLPSAFAMLAVSLLLIWFGYKKLDRPLLGWLMGLLILAAPGLVWQHISRTGDTDAMLTLWVLGLSLSYYLHLYSDERKSKYLLLSIGFIYLGVMTKGIAILMTGPGLLIATLLAGKMKRVLTDKWLYIGGASFIVLSVGYYLLAEQANPGFMKTAWNNEIYQRFLGNKDNHALPFLYYYTIMKQWAYNPWLLLIPLGIALSFFTPYLKEKRFVQFCSVMGIMYLLIISSSSSKLFWYLAPALPLLGVPAAYGIYYFVRLLNQHFVEHPLAVRLMLSCLIILGVYTTPYLQILKENRDKKELPQSRYFDYVQHIEWTETQTKGLKLFERESNPHLAYTSVYFSGEKIIDVEWIRNTQNLSIGDTVISCFKPDIKLLEETFELEFIENNYECQRLIIADYISTEPDSL